MAILPDFLLPIIASYEAELYQWFSDKVFDQMLRDEPKHWLVQIRQRLDIQALKAACSAYRHSGGPGSPVNHAIERLIWALILKYLYDYSYRQLEAELKQNIQMRWFCGYGLNEPILDHTTLWRFDHWVQQTQPRLFFDTVLQQIDTDFPEENPGVQVGDTFAMQANAGLEPLIPLLRHTSLRLLQELKDENWRRYQRVSEALDLERLLGQPKEKHVCYLDKEARRQRLETTVLAVLDLQARVLQSGSLADLPRTRLLLAVLTKILQDEVLLQVDAMGQVIRVEPLPEKKRGSYRILSATDLDASARKHGDQETFGYNISVASTPGGVIREIQAATGAQPDQAGIAALIAAQITHGYQPPDKLIYDQAGGAGKTRAEVERVSQGRTQLVAKIHSTASPDRFGPQDFEFTPDGLGLTCPNQITTRTRDRSGNRDGFLYYWTAKQCQGCPLWNHCRDPKAKPTGRRRVFITDYLEQVRTAQAYNLTDAFRADMKLRPLIERIIAMLTCYDGARRARGRSLEQADYQAKQCAMARNLRTWIQLWDEHASGR